MNLFKGILTFKICLIMKFLSAGEHVVSFQLLHPFPLQSECVCFLDPEQHSCHYNNVYRRRQTVPNAFIIFQALVCSQCAAPLVFTLESTAAAACKKQWLYECCQSCSSLLKPILDSQFHSRCSAGRCHGAPGGGYSSEPSMWSSRAMPSPHDPVTLLIPFFIPSRGDLF